MLGLDYAGGLPGGRAIAAAGYGFVVRYLSPGGPKLPGKLLTQTEYADLTAHGVAVVLNWETTADRMKDGHDAGVTDAQRAEAQLRLVGHPSTRPIYFSADWDATEADQLAIDEYLRGAASVIGDERVGVYGGYWVVKRCLDNGSARWAWQTGAWSGGNRDPRAHIYQRIGYQTVGGVECDVNEALADDFGQHPYEGDTMPTPAELWAYPIEDPYVGPDGAKREPKPAWVFVAYGAANAAYAVQETNNLRTELAAFKAAAGAELAGLKAAMPELVAEQVRAVLAQGVVDVAVTVQDKTG